MKTKNRLLASAVSLLLIVFSVVILASCGSRGDSSCSHDWGEWNETKNATCTALGTRSRTCGKCGVTETDTVSATGHTPMEDDGDCTTPILCTVCGEITVEANGNHIGGRATCQKPAACEACGKEYETVADHEPNMDDKDCTTAVFCVFCGQELVPANESHTGGKASCAFPAECEVCGMQYGTVLDHTPNSDDGDCTSDITCKDCGTIIFEGAPSHTFEVGNCESGISCYVCGMAFIPPTSHTPEKDDGDCTTAVCCSVCGEIVFAANEAHKGEVTNCEMGANCTECGLYFIPTVPHSFSEDDGDCTTAVYCTVCGAVGIDAIEAHSGGAATCNTYARCDICGKEYGELSGHSADEDDGDCTTPIRCTVCGEIAVAANESHIGGEATCTHYAVCEICNTEYGELSDSHYGEIIWMKHLYSHYRVYNCCYIQTSDPEAHKIKDGVCTECGFNPTVTAESVVAAPGERVNVVISVSDNPGITGLMMTVQYSSDVLTLIDAESGAAMDPLVFTEPDELKSGSTFLWDGLSVSDADIMNGEILILSFDVSEQALEGNYSILLNVKAYDNDLNPLNLVISGANITIENK